MKSRRDFIKNAGKGVLATLLASSAGSSNLYAKNNSKQEEENYKKRIRIGIVGAENSHTRLYGRMFNIQKKFPGVEVLYVWGETEEFAKDAVKRGGIPNMVKNPIEMIGKIDAVIVDHRHAKYHLEAVLPFVKAGIPAFVDKPFGVSVAEGKEFLKIARERKTPVTSYSSAAHRDEVLDMKAQVSSIENIQHIIFYGPANVTSEYGGISFYGVHVVQRLLYIFGEDIERLRVSKYGNKVTATLIFKSGYFATIIFASRKWGEFLLTDKGLIKLEPRIKEKDPAKAYRDMVEMFRTGKEPRSHESILKCMAVLEALEKSVISQQWENVVI
ncbi:Gfo/Idh/MocA family oxidoreductase [bacterium]|nr:Gfo/Idh/MocA family oxidoreductase [bacterium]